MHLSLQHQLANNSNRIKMRKLIAAINMTIDGFCDHTAGIPNDELLEHYNELLSNTGTLMYGRTTYQLMEKLLAICRKKPYW